MAMLDNLMAMLGRGQDSALLRYGLGNEYLKQGDPHSAVAHLAEAVRQDPTYSAAWKLYGRALAEVGRHAEAVAVFGQGIDAAERRGDIQAAKEMRVFQGRAARALEGAGDAGR